MRSDAEDAQLPGVPHFFQTWPQSDIVGWQGEEKAVLGLPVNEGGVWTGIESSSIDDFPFVGAVPERPGHFVAAGFNGHGMPRILLSTAHLVPLVLQDLGVAWTAPALTADYPPLPAPFAATAERVRALQQVDAQAVLDASVRAHEESAGKAFCNTARCLAWR